MMIYTQTGEMQMEVTQVVFQTRDIVVSASTSPLSVRTMVVIASAKWDPATQKHIATVDVVPAIGIETRVLDRYSVTASEGKAVPSGEFQNHADLMANGYEFHGSEVEHGLLFVRDRSGLSSTMTFMHDDGEGCILRSVVCQWDPCEDTARLAPVMDQAKEALLGIYVGDEAAHIERLNGAVVCNGSTETT